MPSWATATRCSVGDWCFAMGNPFLLATDFQPTVSYGVISGVHRYQYPAGTLLEYADCLQTDAAINPGNSGGPLFDAQGRLIGINGRGSFEKRGRVNVGVGYAISINQIKNFLGHLKSGRIVDHATLGASVRSDEHRRVVVDDILEESDAYRRGLRYGDEIVSFGGRAGQHGQRLQERAGHLSQGLARAAGVPSTAASAVDDSGAAARRAPRGGAGRNDRRPAQGRARKRQAASPSPASRPSRRPDRMPKRRIRHAKPAPMPEIVKQHFVEKPGYVNYYFNQLNRDRVWKALVARGDYASLAGRVDDRRRGCRWARRSSFELSDTQASIKLPSGELKIELTGDAGRAARSARQRRPAGGAGHVAAVSRRRARKSSARCTIWGTAPLGGPRRAGRRAGRQPIGDVECRFLFDPADGQLVAMEMIPEEDTDPCELYFSEYQGSRGPHAARADRSPPRRRRLSGRSSASEFKFDAGRGEAANDAHVEQCSKRCRD